MRFWKLISFHIGLRSVSIRTLVFTRIQRVAKKAFDRELLFPFYGGRGNNRSGSRYVTHVVLHCPTSLFCLQDWSELTLVLEQYQLKTEYFAKPNTSSLNWYFIAFWFVLITRISDCASAFPKKYSTGIVQENFRHNGIFDLPAETRKREFKVSSDWVPPFLSKFHGVITSKPAATACQRHCERSFTISHSESPAPPPTISNPRRW